MVTYCRDGSQCERNDCKFPHSCPYKEGCTNTKCNLIHPKGRETAAEAARIAKSAKNESKVTEALEARKISALEEPCRYGDNCTNMNCFFLHSETRKKKLAGKMGGSKECRYGDNCTDTTCLSLHSELREENLAKKTSAKIASNCRYGIKCTDIKCIRNHPQGRHVPTQRKYVNVSIVEPEPDKESEHMMEKIGLMKI